MEKDPYKLLERIVKEEYINYSKSLEHFRKKYPSKEGGNYSTEFAKDYINLIFEASELKGLIRATQSFNIKYIPNELSLSEWINQSKKLLFDLLKSEENIKNLYQNYYENYIKKKPEQ